MTTHHANRLAVAGALALAVALTPATSAVAGSASAERGKGAKVASQQSAKKKVAKGAAKKRAAKKRSHSRPVRRKAKTLSEVSVADALAKVPAYTGATGAVIHSRSVTVNFKTTDDPHETRGFTAATERWAEIGGGERLHEITQWTDEDTQQPQGTHETWRTPRVWSIVSDGAPASVGIFCAPLPPVAPDATIREDRDHLSSLPAGPIIDGVATRVGVHAEQIPGAPGPAPEFRNYLDAATGRPIRSTYRPYDAQTISFQTDYSLWELLPAGGPAAALSGVLPAGAELGDDHTGQPGCIG